MKYNLDGLLDDSTKYLYQHGGNGEIEETIALKKKACMKWITTRLQQDRDAYNAMK